MKRNVLTVVVVLSAAFLEASLFAGALLLQVADPQTSTEALANHAVVMVQMTACHSPEKTVVLATAEGTVGGTRKSLPLKVIKLSTPGTFVVARQWPSEGMWAVRMVATNPEYKNFATGVVVPVDKDVWIRAGAKQFFHAPTEDDVNLALKQAPGSN